MPPLRNAGTGPEAEDPEYAGQYRLEARLGSGGMGVVHLARSDSGLRLAVKVVHADHAVDPEFRARFRQEVAAARRVSGAFTAPVVDADPDGARPWMATLYIPGPTLAEHVKRNGPLEPDEVLQLAAGLAEALRDIHRAGVVHRDLKPSNVLLAADGPKVIDFGISRPADSDLRTETGKLIGTPPFMAPEQFQRPRQVGPAADVFALGSVLVHAATGSGPFDSESPYIVAYQVVHDEADLAGVPDELVPLIRRCLAKDPAVRPTPDALMAALRAVRGPYAPAPRGPAPRVPTQRGAERRGRGAAASGAGDGELGGYVHALDDAGDGAGGPGLGARVVDWPEAGAGTADDGAAPPPARRVGSGRRGRRGVRTWVVAALVLAVVLGAGTVWTLRGLDSVHRSGRHQKPHQAAGAAARPWHTGLGAPDEATGGGTGTADGAAGSGSRAAYCGYGRGALYCTGAGVQAARLNPVDGEVVWSRPAADGGRAGGTGGGAPLPPALSGGLVQVLSPDGTRLRGLDPVTHVTRWSRDVSAYGGRIYRAGDTVLAVSADGTVTAIDAATNGRRWRHGVEGHALPGFHTDAAGRTAYAFTVAGDGSRTLVTALDPVHGTTRWKRELDGNLTPVGGDGEVLHLVSTDTRTRTDAIVSYDPETRTARRVPLEAPVVAASVAASGGRVYVLCDDGGLLAVDTRRAGSESAQRWRLETSVGNASPLVAAEDRLYFSAADGRLLAVDAVEGELLGQTPPRPGPPGQGFAGTLPAPVAADGRVFGSAPDGTVFSVDERAPSRW
ncbi:protein kinase domain-containing protein [Streptomyces sp. P1-3]|uniref:serine/threonine-protein kinase n=1 Tax=Streptomyces sp. P1-3 TaxID=3421658 RepID=UPI003D35B547